MPEQRMRSWYMMSESEIKDQLNPDNKKCAFHDYIGNRQAVEEALDLAYSAFLTTFHWEERGIIVNTRECPKRIALLGPPSVGKTHFARKFSEVLDLPYAETDASQINKVDKVFEALESAYAAKGIPLTGLEQEGHFVHYKCPPGILFIDEVHLLSGKTQDAMLKMTEASDGRLILANKIVDCRKLCIIIGTTAVGKLRDALKTRFTKLQLIPHTTEERAQIIKLNNPDWTYQDCLAISKIQPVPREALDFANSVRLLVGRRQCPIKEAITEVSKRRGLESGISTSAMNVLKVLHGAATGLSRRAVCSAIHIEEEEFINDCLPYLLQNDQHPAYISITNKHYITPSGAKLLEGSGRSS